MKRTIFLIAAAGGALTAFLFFQPVSNDGGGLMTPATLASPVASTSEQPVAFNSPDPSPQSTPTTKVATTPTSKIKSPTSGSALTTSPAIPSAPSIQGGGGDDEGEDEHEGGDDD